MQKLAQRMRFSFLGFVPEQMDFHEHLADGKGLHLRCCMSKEGGHGSKLGEFDVNFEDIAGRGFISSSR